MGPAVKFETLTSVNLDGPGYALTLFTVGQIIILALLLGSGLGRNIERHFQNIQVSFRCLLRSTNSHAATQEADGLYLAKGAPKLK